MSDKVYNASEIFKGFDVNKIFAEHPYFSKQAQHIMNIQMNNIEAFNDIQTIMFSNMQEIGQRQNEVFSRIMAQTNQITNDLSKEGRPEDKLAHNINAMQVSYKETMDSVKEISALVRKANDKAVRILKDRAAENYKESQSVLSKAAANE